MTDADFLAASMKRLQDAREAYWADESPDNLRAVHELAERYRRDRLHIHGVECSECRGVGEIWPTQPVGIMAELVDPYDCPACNGDGVVLPPHMSSVIP